MLSTKSRFGLKERTNEGCHDLETRAASNSFVKPGRRVRGPQPSSVVCVLGRTATLSTVVQCVAEPGRAVTRPTGVIGLRGDKQTHWTHNQVVLDRQRYECQVHHSDGLLPTPRSFHNTPTLLHQVLPFGLSSSLARSLSRPQVSATLTTTL